MLNTINGFDLLLIIIITILGFKVYNLNQECESYVGQIIEVSQDNYELTKELEAHYAHTDLPKDLYGCVCNYCTDSDPWSTECQDFIGTPPNTYNDPHLTDPSKCDCDDCWTVHPKFQTLW